MKKTGYIISGILFSIFFIKCRLLLDPDFGWHLRMGQYILRHGLPLHDSFSYTMSSYPFIDHEWLGEILLTWLYPMIGITGLSILFSLIAVLSLLIPILALPKKQRQFTLIPLLLAGIAFVFFIGIRLQLISWLFFSILVWLLFEKLRYRLWRFILPLLFLLWANIHGGFAIGIGFYFLFLLFSFIREREITLMDCCIFFLSIFATCINPYGIHLWSIIWIHTSSSLNHWAIQEWLPPIFFTSTFALWFFFALSIMILFLYRKRFSKGEIVLYLVLLLMAASSMRNVPLWLLWALPLTVRALFIFYEEIKPNPPSEKAFHKMYALFLGIICVIAITELGYDLLQATAISENNFYPKQAIDYLSAHPSKGQLFSVYEWGGYVDWKLPHKKVFIDGRMPTWDHAAAGTEESNAFQTYINLLHGKVQFAQLEKKYSIDTVLVPTEKVSKNTLLTQLNETLGKWFHQKNKEVDLNKEFEKVGMKVVYKDSVAVVWRKQ